MIFTTLLLTVVPLSTVEIPHDAYAQGSVLGSKTLAMASATVKPVAPKPAVAKKPVAKKVVKKKAPVKKKERLITAPPLITVDTAPSSPKKR